MGDWTGTVPTILAGQRPTGDDWDNVTDELTALSAAWSTFVPAWTSSGTPPAIGSSTVLARYRRVGKTVDFQIYILFAGATFGTGNYFFALPVSASGSPVTEQAGSGWAFDASTGVRQRGAIRILAGTTMEPHFTDAAGGQMSATSPWTWANGDWFMLGATYTVA